MCHKLFLISNLCCVLNVVFFVVGDLLASEVYLATFQNIVSVPPSQTSTYLPMKMELTECSEMLVYKPYTPANH
jgi:hypothetical protein